MTLIAYLHLTRQKPAPVPEYREGAPYLVVGKAFRTFLEYYRRGTFGLVDLALSVMTARVFPFFEWRDPPPFVIAPGGGIRQQISNGPKNAPQEIRRRAARSRVT